MNGQIIPGTCIAVDFWKIKGVQNQLVHFLTHLHGDHITGLTSSWSRPIYCSEFTAQILEAHYGVSKSLMKILYTNQCALIEVPGSSDTFCVTAYDANHCPGALMLYFEGSFGNIFHTGDFRFSNEMMESLHHLVGKIDKLYLDNTFCSPDCVFPSREKCQQEIMKIAKDHPDSDIIIGVRKLGKESMLGMLAVELNETISVSPPRYQITNRIFDSNVFVVASKDQKTRLSTLPLHSITRELIYKRNQFTPTIAIMPTAIFTGLSCKAFSRDPKIFVVPYSDHSSFPELVEFVRKLQPSQILPIVTSKRGPFGKDISHRCDMSLLESHLKKDKISAQSIESRSIVVEDGHGNQSEENCTQSNEDTANISCSEEVNVIGRKCLYLKPKLSSCENGLEPIPSLKRKKSFPDKRKKKVAKGVMFQEDFVDPLCVPEKVTYNNNKSANKEKSIPSSLRGNVEVEELHCVSESASSDEYLQTNSLIGNPHDHNKNLEKPCCISQIEVVNLIDDESFQGSSNENNLTESASVDGLSYESSVNLTNVDVKDNDTLPDSECYDDSIIESLVALHGGTEDSLNQIRKGDETSYVNHNLENAEGKESQYDLETELSIKDSLHHKGIVTRNSKLDKKKKMEKPSCVSQKELLKLNSDTNFQCSGTEKGALESATFQKDVGDNNAITISSEGMLPNSNSESLDDGIVENLIALEGGGDDSINRTKESVKTLHSVVPNLQNQAAIHGNNSQSQELQKSTNPTFSKCDSYELGQVVSSKTVIQELKSNANSKLDSEFGEPSNVKVLQNSVCKCSEITNSYRDKERVNECVKVCSCSNQRSTDLFTKAVKSSSPFRFLRSKMNSKSKEKKFSVRHFLQDGNDNKLSKFNNDKEFHNALAALM